MSPLLRGFRLHLLGEVSAIGVVNDVEEPLEAIELVVFNAKAGGVTINRHERDAAEEAIAIGAVPSEIPERGPDG